MTHLHLDTLDILLLPGAHDDIVYLPTFQKAEEIASCMNSYFRKCWCQRIM